MKANRTSGWFNGFVGVILFSGSLPATRLAVLELSPLFVTVARASIAGILALIALSLFKEKRPSKKQFVSLGIVAFGVVLGYPLLSALALQYLSSAHSIVFLGILPLSTAIFGIIRGGERPNRAFWIFSAIGSAFVIGYSVMQGLDGSLTGNVLMFLAILLCGLGYAEGAKLTKIVGGWQVISWALLISLPVMLPLVFIYMPAHPQEITAQAWISLGYVAVFSMFIGFIFWYKGLAAGGIAVVGQLQLLQPFFGLALAAYLLNEQVSAGMLIVTLVVILCVAGTKRFAQKQAIEPRPSGKV